MCTCRGPFPPSIPARIALSLSTPVRVFLLLRSCPDFLLDSGDLDLCRFSPLFRCSLSLHWKITTGLQYCYMIRNITHDSLQSKTYLMRVTRKQTLRSLSLSYQKKDGHARPRPLFFWYDIDFLEFESFDGLCCRHWCVKYSCHRIQ